MNILVLGGNGFIGNNLIEKLVEIYDNITVFDNKYPDKKYDKVKYIVGNFEQIDNYRDIFKNIDIVYHLISTTTPNADKNNIIFDIETNLIPSIKLLNICIDANVKKIIFTSSGGGIYGEGNNKHLENAPCSPCYAYGINKLCIELYIKFFHKFYNLDYTILRISNPYGKNHKNKKQGLINVMIDKQKNNQPIQIYGDGHTIRDYIYIDDVTEALLCAIPKNKSKVFNIGTGIGYSINELINILSRLSNNTLNIQYLPKRSVDINKNILDVTHAYKELGWKAKIDIETGIKKILDGD